MECEVPDCSKPASRGYGQCAGCRYLSWKLQKRHREITEEMDVDELRAKENMTVEEFLMGL